MRQAPLRQGECIGTLGHVSPGRVQQHQERAVRRLLQRRVVFGGVWLALGLAMLSLVAQIEREGRLFAVLWGAVFLGGVGRALSMAWLGLPPAPFIGFTVLELVGAPAFIVWQRRVARAAPAHA